MPFLLLFMSLLLSEPSFAKVESLSSSEIIDAIVAKDPTYQDVEEALRMRFNHLSSDVREYARDLTDFPAALSIGVYEQGIRSLNAKAADASQRSSFLQALRREILLVIDIYLHNQLQPEPRTRRLTDIEAWQRAQSKMDEQYPGWRGDEAFHREMLRQFYARAQNQTVDVWEKSKPEMPTAKEVIARLERLRLQLIRKILHQFFDAMDLSLYKENKVHENGFYEIHHTRIRNLSPGEILDLPLEEGEFEVLKSGQLYLALTEPGEQIADTRIRVIGEIHNIRGSAIGTTAFNHFNSSLELKDTDFEYFLADLLIDHLTSVLERLTLPQADVQVELARLRTDIEKVFTAPTLAGKGLNIAQFLHSLFISQDKDYFKKRDALAKQNGLPSLKKRIETETRPRSVKKRLTSLFTQLKTSIVESVEAALSPREPESANSSWQEFWQARKSTVLRFEGKSWLAPIPMAFNLSPVTDHNLRPWAPGGEEDFAVTTEVPVLSERGQITVPTTFWGQVVSLKLMHGKRELQLNKDFTALANAHLMRIQLASPINDEFALRVGFHFVPLQKNRSTTLDLRSLDPRGFLPEVAELHRAGLHRLAEALAGLVENAIAANRSISAYSIKRIVHGHSRYSFNEQYRGEPINGAEGPYAPYSGFLNPQGLLFIQCDTANDLFALLFARYFAHDPSIEVRALGSIFRLPFQTNIPAMLGHKRTYFFQNGQLVTIIDATPPFMDLQGLFKKQEDYGVDNLKEEQMADIIADTLSTDTLASRLEGIKNRLETLKAELIAQPATQLALKRIIDPTHPVLKGLQFTNRDLINDELVELTDEARKYQSYLEQGLRTRAAHLRTGLENDTIAMDRLNQIFSLLSDLGSTSSCEQMWP